MSAETITIKITREGHSLLVSFRYHPKLVEQIKSLPPSARQWDSARKVWVVKQEILRQLLDLFKGARLEFVPKDLLEQLTTSDKPVLCFICGSVINCNKCSYSDLCPVKNEVTYCVCLNDIYSKHLFDLYSVEKFSFLSS